LLRNQHFRSAHSRDIFVILASKTFIPLVLN
jgi:hypothetical protein